jgi:hypothetical protein
MSEPKLLSIEWIGPEGQTSDLFGPLVAGRRYQAAADLAAYLCQQHPEYWRAPAEKSAAPAKG